MTELLTVVPLNPHTHSVFSYQCDLSSQVCPVIEEPLCLKRNNNKCVKALTCHILVITCHILLAENKLTIKMHTVFSQIILNNVKRQIRLMCYSNADS